MPCLFIDFFISPFVQSNTFFIELWNACLQDAFANNMRKNSSALYQFADYNICIWFKEHSYDSRGHKSIVISRVHDHAVRASSGQTKQENYCLSWQQGERAVQEQTVTWVWVEQIDSEPLSTSSRHTAFIIIRRQERFEASRGSSGQTEQASKEARDGALELLQQTMKRTT